MRAWVTSSQSLTAISWPTRLPSVRTSTSIIFEPSALRIKASSFRNQLLQHRRRLPVVAEPGAILLHAREDRRQADGVGVEHRPAAVAREAEAVDVDDVDVPRPR